jgi:transposase
MGEVSTIGVDIAKSVFQIHGIDVDGTVVIRKRVGRAKFLELFSKLPACLVGMEACATAHQWARELKKLGHNTRLMFGYSGILVRSRSCGSDNGYCTEDE